MEVMPPTAIKGVNSKATHFLHLHLSADQNDSLEGLLYIPHQFLKAYLVPFSKSGFVYAATVHKLLADIKLPPI